MEKVPARGIEERLTGDEEPTAAMELGAIGNGGFGLGFEGKGGRPGEDKERARGADSAQIRTHTERGSLARGTWLAGGGGDACGAEQSRGRRRGG